VPKRILALAIVALALAGCGASKKAAPPESDSAQVVSATHRFLAALGEGDGAVACSLLTPEAQRQLLKSARTEFQSCEGEVSGIQKLLGIKESAELHTARVAVASLSGAKARAEVTIGGERSVYPLSKTSAGWRLDAASVAPSPK
jgi:hypothetical protein